jgi:hypothetical protein
MSHTWYMETEQSITQAVQYKSHYVPFWWTDGGKVAAGFSHEILDCVVRAIAIGFNKAYNDAHRLVAHYTGRKDGYTTNGQATRTLLNKLGVVVDTQITVGQFCKAHPSGRYICHMQGHLFAIVDGIVCDTRMMAARVRINYYTEIL